MTTFDFDKWSEKIYEVVDKIDYANGNQEQHEKKLVELWDELMDHQDLESYQVLLQIKNKTKGLIEGQVDDNEFRDFMRDLHITLLDEEQKLN